MARPLYWPLDFAFARAWVSDELRPRSDGRLTLGAQALGVGHDLTRGPAALAPRRREIGRLPFPLLDDSKRELARELGLLRQSDNRALRATFIVDLSRVIRWVRVSDASVGRNVPEVLRALHGLQTPEDRVDGAPAARNRLILMCAWCKNVRDPGGSWSDMEEFMHDCFGADFTHGMCPRCFREQSSSTHVSE